MTGVIMVGVTTSTDSQTGARDRASGAANRLTDARQRMIRSAALLFRRQGIEGTSFSDVLDHSGAPRGSIYHHFPGGKAQLAEEATRYAGDFIAAGLVAALADDDPVAAIRSFASSWMDILRQADFTDGCPVAAAAIEGDKSPGARAAAAAAFTRWEQLIAGAIEGRGVPADRARSVAALVVSAIEGAIVVSRAQRSTEPLERVAAEIEQLVASLTDESALLA
jgi:TetR/AcrR family transcriptional regulator, lmrAB and yxaGH operons repressor